MNVIPRALFVAVLEAVEADGHEYSPALASLLAELEYARQQRTASPELNRREARERRFLDAVPGEWTDRSKVSRKLNGHFTASELDGFAAAAETRGEIQVRACPPRHGRRGPAATQYRRKRFARKGQKPEKSLSKTENS